MDLDKPARPKRKRSETDDEAKFSVQWPKASQYWPPQDREMFQAYIPGWFPGCDMNTVCRENKFRDPSWREPLWFEWPRIREAWPAMVYLPTLTSMFPQVAKLEPEPEHEPTPSGAA